MSEKGESIDALISGQLSENRCVEAFINMSGIQARNVNDEDLNLITVMLSDVAKNQDNFEIILRSIGRFIFLRAAENMEHHGETLNKMAEEQGFDGNDIDPRFKENPPDKR